MTKPIPFHTRARREVIRKGLATRARRRALLAMAHANQPLEALPAPVLESLFWDVREWVPTLPQNHANTRTAADFEERIVAEYERRNQETPLLAAQRRAVEALEALFGGAISREERAKPLRLSLLPDESPV